MRLNSNMEGTLRKFRINPTTSFHQWKYYHGWLKICQLPGRIRALQGFQRFGVLFEDRCVCTRYLVFINLAFPPGKKVLSVLELFTSSLCICHLRIAASSMESSLFLTHIKISVSLLYTFPLPLTCLWKLSTGTRVRRLCHCFTVTLPVHVQSQ